MNWLSVSPGLGSTWGPSRLTKGSGDPRAHQVLEPRPASLVVSPCSARALGSLQGQPVWGTDSRVARAQGLPVSPCPTAGLAQVGPSPCFSLSSVILRTPHRNRTPIGSTNLDPVFTMAWLKVNRWNFQNRAQSALKEPTWASRAEGRGIRS